MKPTRKTVLPTPEAASRVLLRRARLLAFALTVLPERFFKRSGFLFVVILRSVF
jgi:hypothetical protein